MTLAEKLARANLERAKLVYQLAPTLANLARLRKAQRYARDIQ